MENYNPYDFGDPIGNFYQGYQQAFIPQQIKQQQAAALQEQKMNAMKQDMMAQKMESEPQMNAMKLKQLELQNKGLGIDNDVAMQNLQKAKIEAARRAEFMKFLQGNTNPSQQKQSSENTGSNNSSTINYDSIYGASPSKNMGMNGIISNSPMGYTNNQQSSPMDQLDAIWQNPAARAQYGDFLKEMGVSGKEQIFNNPTTGELIKTSTLPSGKVKAEVIQAGMSPYERSFQSAEAADEAGILKNMHENAFMYQQNADDLHMINSVLGDPKLESIMGPMWQSKITNLAGKKEYQELLGAINVATGDYYNRMLNLSKGNPSNFDAMQLLKTKINTETDSVGVAIGKARALNILNLTSQRREEIAQSLVDQGMKPSQAKIQANKQIPLDSTKKEVDALVQGKQLMNTPDGKVVAVPFDMVDQALSNGGSIYGK